MELSFVRGLPRGRGGLADGVRIGEAGNQVLLTREEWNVLVDLIATGGLTRL